MKIEEEIIRKFSMAENIQELEGGQGESVKAGQLIIKPVHDEEEYIWISNVLTNLNFSDLNIAKPIFSLAGNYIENGFGATHYFNNIGHIYDVNKNLELCRKLNQILQNVSKPPTLFDNLNNQWKKAHFLAWHGKENKALPDELQLLMSLRVDIDLPEQLIHVDLAGNILVNKYNETCIIDFTPGFYPKEYAEAILLVDSVSWYQAPINFLNEIRLDKKIVFQLILRALIFRMSVSLLSEPSLYKNERFYDQLNSFKKVYNYLTS